MSVSRTAVSRRFIHRPAFEPYILCVLTAVRTDDGYFDSRRYSAPQCYYRIDARRPPGRNVTGY